MRVAAIDVGTNSVHLLVADVAPDGAVTVVEKAREQVELGRGGFGQNRITDDAMQRGLEAMSSFKQAIDSLEVEVVLATATSAVREAANGSTFTKMVRERTGIHIRVISGLDEARLIYLGAREDLDFSRGYALLCDLGGGSAEFILCDSSQVLSAHSLPLGHIRLAERFHRSDPMTTAEVDELRRYVRKQLQPILRDVRPGTFGRFVGTSGAIRTLGRMAAMAAGLPEPQHGHGLVLKRGDLKKLVAQFTRLKSSRLGELPGMDTRRRETLPSAAVMLYEVMRTLGRDELVTSERSLRDGLLVDWVIKHQPEIALSGTVAWPRMRSVLGMMKRYQVDEPHAERVRQLSLDLFDGLEEVHGLGAEERRMLEFAALLHDVGHHIAGASHNKHGQYLILHSRMAGFTAPEIAVLGNIVRYHRGGRPKRRHRQFGSLSRTNQRRVQVLSSLLRLADALDRSHNQPVRAIRVEHDASRVRLVAEATTEAHLERWTAERRKNLLARVLGRELEVDIVVVPES